MEGYREVKDTPARLRRRLAGLQAQHLLLDVLPEGLDTTEDVEPWSRLKGSNTVVCDALSLATLGLAAGLVTPMISPATLWIVQDSYSLLGSVRAP